jgi:hypothetical protein
MFLSTCLATTPDQQILDLLRNIEQLRERGRTSSLTYSGTLVQTELQEPAVSRAATGSRINFPAKMHVCWTPFTPLASGCWATNERRNLTNSSCWGASLAFPPRPSSIWTHIYLAIFTFIVIIASFHPISTVSP